MRKFAFLVVTLMTMPAHAGPWDDIIKYGYAVSGGPLTGAMAWAVCEQTADDATPSIGTPPASLPAGCNILLTSESHSGPVTITGFDDAESGIEPVTSTLYEQILWVVGRGATNQTTIADGGNFRLKEISWDSPASGDHSVIQFKATYMTGSITAFADAGGGQVTVTSAGHGLQENQTVTISGTADPNYTGTFTATNVLANTYEITTTWGATDTGTWESARFDELWRSGNVDDYFYKRIFVNEGNATDFTQSQIVVGESDTGITGITAKTAIAGEAAADGTNPGIGVLGYGETSSAQAGSGGMFQGTVAATGDTTTSYGAQGLAQQTHAGGSNVGLYGYAGNGATNYGLQIGAGDINTIQLTNWLLVDNNATALTWDAAGAADILKIITTNGEETVAHTSKFTGSSVLDAGSGDEYAWDLAYETNKATSGDSYGLRIRHTATAVPAGAYLLDVAGVGSMVLDVAGNLSLDSGAAATQTTSFLYNSGTTGEINAYSSQFSISSMGTNTLALQTETVTGTSPSAAAAFFTGNQGNVGAYATGDLTFGTGNTTTAGTTGNLIARTGQAGAGTGDAGSFIVQTHGTNTRLTIDGAGTATFTGPIDAESYMAIGDGSALDAGKTLLIDRDFSSASDGEALSVNGSQIEVTAGTGDIHHTMMNPGSSTFSTAATVHNYVTTLNLLEPNVALSDGATVANAATLRIVNAPTEGTTSNWALWVDSGNVKMDGDLTVDGTATLGGLVMAGDLDMDWNDILDLDEMYGQAPTSDMAPGNTDWLIANAYAAATGGNQTGASANVRTGIGSRYITITDKANSANDVWRGVIDGTGTPTYDLVADTDFTCSTAADNAECALNYMNAFNAKGWTVTASCDDGTCSTAKVYLQPDDNGIFAFTHSIVDAGGGGAMGTATSGTDGSFTVHTGHNAFIVGPTSTAVGGDLSMDGGKFYPDKDDVNTYMVQPAADQWQWVVGNLTAMKIVEGTDNFVDFFTFKLQLDSGTRIADGGADGDMILSNFAGTQGIKFDTQTNGRLVITDESAGVANVQANQFAAVASFTSNTVGAALTVTTPSTGGALASGPVIIRSGSNTNTGNYPSGDVTACLTGDTTTDGDTGDCLYTTGVAGAGQADAGDHIWKVHGTVEAMRITGATGDVDVVNDLTVGTMTSDGVLSGTHIITTSGTTAHAFGDTAYNYSQFKFSGNFTSGGADQHAEKVLIQGSLTGAGGDTQRLSTMDIMGSIATQTAEETIGLAAQVIIRDPTITDNLTGVGVITDAATLYVEAAPTEGSVRNAALLVDSGATILDGTLSVGLEATFLNNAAAATFGDVTTDADVVLAFDAVTAQGSITYMEDEDRFDFDNDVDVVGALTAGSMASDGTISGTGITGTSFVIGANTLDTNEWAFLDGQDQDVSSDAVGVTFGSLDMGSATATLEIPNGTDLPATCTVGQLFQDTDDNSCADAGGGDGVICACKATDTWAVVADL